VSFLLRPPLRDRQGLDKEKRADRGLIEAIEPKLPHRHLSFGTLIIKKRDGAETQFNPLATGGVFGSFMGFGGSVCRNFEGQIAG
jgi:hypothetical protein